MFSTSFSSTELDLSFLQSKSMVRCSDSGDGDSKASPPSHSNSNKEHLSSIVREISQARLMSFRKKRSGQSMTLGISDNGNVGKDRTVWIGMKNVVTPANSKQAGQIVWLWYWSTETPRSVVQYHRLYE